MLNIFPSGGLNNTHNVAYRFIVDGGSYSLLISRPIISSEFCSAPSDAPRFKNIGRVRLGLFRVGEQFKCCSWDFEISSSHGKRSTIKGGGDGTEGDEFKSKSITEFEPGKRTVVWDLRMSELQGTAHLGWRPDKYKNIDRNLKTQQRRTD